MQKHLIAVKDIHIASNRQRREFKPAELNDLADSIERIGLLHPIVLREADGKFILVAGERRFKAVQDLYELGREFSFGGEPVPDACIPCTLIGELSPLEAMEAELEENVRRVDLTWAEKALATARLTELRTGQAAAKGLPAPSVADISLEVRGSNEGINQENTRREIILARHLDDPDVKAAKTANDAFKVLRRKEEITRHAALAERVGRNFSAALHTCTQANALEWLALEPKDKYDLILTDPPYGMGADEFGDSGHSSYGSHAYVDSEANAMKCYAALAKEGFRVTKPEAHLYAFCDLDLFHDLREMFTLAGWRVFRTPLIWYKPAAYRAPWPEHGPQRKYETILYAVKGDKKTLKLAGDVITCAPDDNLGHAAQKPVALLTELLRRSARPGDLVLDPFCGSGSIFPAAHELTLTATGVELDPAMYGIAVSRIQALGVTPP